MEDGALTKEYVSADKEVEQAVQMAVQQITFEDERYLVRQVLAYNKNVPYLAYCKQEKDPPSLNIEYPVGTRVIFLGEHAYGRAAQVTGINGTSLSIQIAVSLTSPVRRCAGTDSCLPVAFP